MAPGLPQEAYARTPGAPERASQGRLRVFLDCHQCFPTFLRDETAWVDFVRQPQDADVQLLSTASETGGAGTEITLRFVGQGRFNGIDTDLRAHFVSSDTEDTRRRGVLRAVSVGLLGYLERAGLGAGVELAVEPVGQARLRTAVVDDPWNAWVFSVRGGRRVTPSARTARTPTAAPRFGRRACRPS